ncbi:hypothetical protein [Ureibacillus chungkukjangi]|uniref:Uncharacterized protein n=1 Tax=Ureibacillus chungkukjangi TaxID=1202712 RepID=A0A318TGT8_9BACL|nr:hypothetical protein [Ureibacillus chungkukjangi]PYF03067.1 hypothetical protein BJ095_13423 [Ureibacillus chungkukjangi]
MYEKITIENSILYIEPHHVDTFKQWAAKMDNYSHLVKNGALSKMDSWIMAFNIWLLLLPDDDDLIIKTDESSLYYTANILIHNAFKEDSHFQNLKERNDSTPELFYLSSLYLATGLNEWILNVLEKYQLQDIIQRARYQRYFNALDGTKEQIQTFLEDQSQFVKAAVLEIREGSFSQMIKKYCDKAYFLYVDQYLSSIGQDKK